MLDGDWSSDVCSSDLVVPMLTDVANRIEEGASLSDSLAVYPRFTSQLFYNIVRVGEETGTLDQSFIYLAELFENEKEVVERIKVATRYPKIVIVTLLAAVFFLMSYVVPKFMALFASAKVDLPLPTRILVVMSRATTEYFWLLAIVVALIVFGYRFAMRDEGVQMARDRLWLRIPIFGDLFLKIFMSRFCRVFSALLRSGVDIIRTLELSATSMDNLVLFSMVDKVTVDVRDGMELHLAMERHKLFPAMVIQMVAIGEQAGQVDEMMGKVAEYYEKETSYTIKNLSTLIEPILLVCMGIMVGFLALAIYMPMWDMINVMHG
jgi:type II secretory pathway component PulF